MKHSTNRILTSHAGSLPRPPALIEVNQAKLEGRAPDEKTYEERLRQAVADIARKQAELGIDVINDGEFGKVTRGAVDYGACDGAALLLGIITGLRGAGLWSDERGTNLLDSGAHFYEVYETRDGKHVAVGAIEPQFYASLIDKLGLTGEALPAQMDRASWPAMKARFAEIFKTKTRDEWCAIMNEADTCVAPVLSIDEAPTHPHARARAAFVDVDGAIQPAPAPRFSRTPSGKPAVAAKPGAHTDELLTEAKFAADEIAALRSAGVIG